MREQNNEYCLEQFQFNALKERLRGGHEMGNKNWSIPVRTKKYIKVNLFHQVIP